MVVLMNKISNENEMKIVSIYWLHKNIIDYFIHSHNEQGRATLPHKNATKKNH